MKQTKKHITLLLTLILTGIGGYLWYKESTSTLLGEYTKLYEYRRLSPDIIPTGNSIRLTDAWHHNLYGILKWIQLIQFIGDNIVDNEYLTFTEKIVRHITELHPHFTKAYEVAILFAPSFDKESVYYSGANLPLGERILELADIGIRENCDPRKIAEITRRENDITLWKDATLRNPCSNGMIAYNAWFVANNMEKREKAEYYYKIASTQDDAPEASGLLGIFARAKAGDYATAASRFFLTAVSWYDEAPYTCQDLALEMSQKLGSKKGVIPTEKEILWYESLAKKLITPKDTTNPLSNSTTNCYESSLRGFKQIFIWYITELTRGRDDIRTGDDIVSQKLIPHIPKVPGQEKFQIRRLLDSTWWYREI